MRRGRSAWRAARLAPAGLAAVALAVAALVAGCEVDPGRPHANLPPETWLSVRADTSGLDTTNYRQVLHWWGSDPDGEVAAYAYRWTGAWRAPADSARWSADTTWVLTTATSDRFVVPLEGTYGVQTFMVVAIDDEGLDDPTPVSEDFRLENSAPTVYWKASPPLPVTSLPAVTFFWGGADPDGYQTIASYRVWLEGESPAQARVVRGDSSITIVPGDFAHYGENTVYVQAVDEALAEGNVISHTWTVEEPTGQALLIDAVRSTDTGAAGFDAFYRAHFDTAFGQGDYYVLDLEQRDFRTVSEVGPTMSLFPVVVWYTGVSSNEPNREAGQFAKASSGIREYVLDYGGSILISSMTAIGSSGGISEGTASEVFGTSRLYADSLGSTNLLVRNGSVFNPSAASGWADTLRTQSSFGGTLSGTAIRFGVDFFGPGPGAVPLYFLPPHTLDGRNRISQDDDYYAGIAHEVAGGGRAILLTFPLQRADSRGNAGLQFRAQLAYLLAGSRLHGARAGR